MHSATRRELIFKKFIFALPSLIVVTILLVFTFYHFSV